MTYSQEQAHRVQAAESREEQLDWLHEIHEEMRAQTTILRAQAESLRGIRMHTGLLYALAIIWIILSVLCLLFYVMSQ